VLIREPFASLRFPEPLPLICGSPFIREDEHYPPETQEIYNSFSSRNLIMKNGNELESFKGRG